MRKFVEVELHEAFICGTIGAIWLVRFTDLITKETFVVEVMPKHNFRKDFTKAREDKFPFRENIKKFYEVWDVYFNKDLFSWYTDSIGKVDINELMELHPEYFI